MEIGEQDVDPMTPDPMPTSMYPWHLVWCDQSCVVTAGRRLVLPLPQQRIPVSGGDVRIGECPSREKGEE